jgi:hydrogenase maturation protease
MEQSRKEAVILACGNTLRGDDGVAWRIAEQLQALPSSASAELILTQQWMPEHADALSRASLAIFLDCSASGNPGVVKTIALSPASGLPRIFTHHLDPASLLRLTLDLYGELPPQAFAITVGGDRFELNEALSDAVTGAIPAAIESISTLLLEARHVVPSSKIPHAGKNPPFAAAEPKER